MDVNEYEYWKKHDNQPLDNEVQVRGVIEAGWLLLFSRSLKTTKNPTQILAAFQARTEEDGARATSDHQHPQQQEGEPTQDLGDGGEVMREKENAEPADAPKPASTSLSLAEVMELVQRGEPVPGIRQIPNTLSEETPAPSTMQPRPKPWETRLDQTPAQTQTQTPSPDNIQQQQ